MRARIHLAALVARHPSRGERRDQDPGTDDSTP